MKKKLLIILLAAAALCALLAVTASAEGETSGTCGEDLTWAIDGEGTLTISGTGAMTDYASSSDSPFHSMLGDIKALVIGEGVTSIGSYAFHSCYALQEVNIPGSVKKIGSNAFESCYMTTLTIGEGVTEIGKNAFSDCYQLTAAAVPDSVTAMGMYTFYRCENMKTVSLGDGLTEIPYGAFGGCQALEQIDIGSGTKVIGDYVFNSCKNLTRIVIPEGVTSLGRNNFYNCPALCEAVLPYTLESFNGTGGMNAANPFDGCAEDLVIKGYEHSHAQLLAAVWGLNWDSSDYGDCPVTEITVSTQEAFDDVLQNVQGGAKVLDIPSHVRIVLDDGLYEMKNAITLEKVVDVTIAAKNPGKVELLSRNAGTPVVQVGNSGYVTLDGLILGHSGVSSSYGSCTGTAEAGLTYYGHAHVVSAVSVNGLEINACDLWGCGLSGTFLQSSRDVRVTDSILRDCVYGAVYAASSDAVYDNCIISGNDYKDKHSYPCVTLAKAYNGDAPDVRFNDCLFFNNRNTEKVTAEFAENCAFNGCTFRDNAFDGETPGNYGVCLGGVTWQAEGGTLTLGKNVGDFLKSETGAVPAYSEYACPWKNLKITETVSGGTMTGDDEKSIEYAVKGREVTVSGDVSDASPVIMASYNEQGQMLSVAVLRSAGESAAVDEDADTARLFWLGGGYKPLSETAELTLGA